MARADFGGQALLEGVLMRGRGSIAVALRHPDGSIVATTERLDSLLHRSRFARTPFFRGLVVLYETLVVGTRWLMRSGSVQAQGTGQEMGRGMIAVTLLLTVGLAVGLFVLLPLFLANATTRATIGPNQALLDHLLEGVFRVFIFIGYLLVVSRSAEIRRVFQYHGAEHMTIHALEAGDPLVVDSVRKYPTAHPRCGTEFLVVVIALSIVAFSLVGRQEPAVMIGSRIALIPVIAAVGYEILKWGAKHRGNAIVRAIMYPGILVQMITTRQPTNDMIEVAIVSMEEALKADGETLPLGSGTLPRDGMDVPAAPKATEGAVSGVSATTDAVSTGGAAVTIDPPLPGA
jgi:uncharacterized protein YqhQ